MVNKAIKNIVDQNRVSSLFRDTFTGPTCLYHWLSTKRPVSQCCYLFNPVFTSIRDSFDEQAFIVTKKQKTTQRNKRITLEELFRRREREEELLSTSRTKRSLQLTFEGLV
ncbi:5937_t:CDS:2, partial [Acaulospora morrowiae]